MKKYKLMMVVPNADEAEEGGYLTLDNGDYDKADLREPKANELTPKSIAEALDQDAENCNCHDFCGVHVKLAALLQKRIGKAARAVMLDLATNRGLHGLDDNCGCRSE